MGIQMIEDIRENIKRVKERIFEAALRSGRNPEDILLVAVTKNVAVANIKVGIDSGLDILGENRVQEAQDKIAELGHGVQWHLIGHLQTNKVKKAIALFDLIHSVDSLHLASEIEKRASGAEQYISVLLEVNMAGEETKSGFSKKGLWKVLDQIVGLKHIRLLGLMTIPPWSDHSEDSRPYFRDLARLKDAIAERYKHGIDMKYLSMGMSQDFEVAIEEGANMVRIGTALFGARCKP